MESDSRLVGAAESILDRALAPEETAGLERYIDLVLEWQQAYRLVGSSDRRWIVDNIVVDSLLFSLFLPFHGGRVLDFGSGAGVPGIPLAITGRDLSLCLLEPRRRRASFLATVVRTLALPNARVLSTRSDQALAQEPALHKAFDAVVSRCAGPVAEVARLSQPFLKRGGRLVLSGSPTPQSTPRVSGWQPDCGVWRAVAHPTLGRSRNFFVAAAAD